MSFDSREKSVYGGEPWECYWFSMGAFNWTYTSGDEPRTVFGRVFEPESISRTEISQNQEMNSGEITVTLPLENPVAQLFMGMLPTRPVSLVIYRGHDGETEITTSFTGIVSSCPCKDTAELKVVTDQDALKISVPGLTYCSQCPRVLFSAGCGVNQAAYMQLATLSYATGVTIKSAAFATKPNGYFTAGWVELEGATRTIVNHVGDTITLIDAMVELVPGTVVQAYPGCQGTEAYCDSVFNNLVNCLAFGHIPSINPFGANGVG